MQLLYAWHHAIWPIIRQEFHYCLRVHLSVHNGLQWHSHRCSHRPSFKDWYSQLLWMAQWLVLFHVGIWSHHRCPCRSLCANKTRHRSILLFWHLLGSPTYLLYPNFVYEQIHGARWHQRLLRISKFIWESFWGPRAPYRTGESNRWGSFTEPLQATLSEFQIDLESSQKQSNLLDDSFLHCSRTVSSNFRQHPILLFNGKV